jgi:hypothetical protein
MQFVSDYMKAIDFVALAALVVIAAASFSRGGTIWLLVAVVVVAIWGASRSVINLKTIKSLGLTVPAAVLARADAVVE